MPVSRWSEVGIQLAHRHKHSNSKLNLLFKRWGSQCSESSHSQSATLDVGAAGFVSTPIVLLLTHRHRALLQPFPAVMESPCLPIPPRLTSVVFVCTLWPGEILLFESTKSRNKNKIFPQQVSIQWLRVFTGT